MWVGRRDAAVKWAVKRLRLGSAMLRRVHHCKRAGSRWGAQELRLRAFAEEPRGSARDEIDPESTGLDRMASFW